MNFVLELGAIGLYCVLLLEILTPLIHNYLVILFLIGCLKHLTLRELYCKFSHACGKVSASKIETSAFILNSLSEPVLLFCEFLVEGFVFLLGGYVVTRFIQQFSNRILKSREFAVFVVGSGLHFFGEMFEIHTRFCMERCQLAE
jgi:hypothetical protein